MSNESLLVIGALALATACYIHGHDAGQRGADRYWQARGVTSTVGYISCPVDDKTMIAICVDDGKAWVERGTVCHADQKERIAP